VLSEAIIAGALVVLCLVGVLILLELRRGRASQPARANRPLRSSIPAPLGAADEHDITLYSRQPKLPVIEDEPDGSDEETPSSALTLFEHGAEWDEPTGSQKMFLVWASGQTDRGVARRKNEDAILLLEDYSLFVVADGMGGYAGGDVASKLACETIEKVFRSGELRSKAGQRESDRPRRADELVYAIEAANDAIRVEAQRQSGYHKMGATVVGARFMERKQRAFIGHIGDSRCYRMRGDELRLLTTDHTMAAKGVPGPMGQHVRRALGVTPRVQVDLLVDKPLPGDVYVLCSDGLNKMLEDDAIAGAIRSHRDNLQVAVRTLIDKANAAGGKDNVSVVLVGIRPNESPTKVA
jgi:serine/threonine protein phosphatase PrpC